MDSSVVFEQSHVEHVYDLLRCRSNRTTAYSMPVFNSSYILETTHIESSWDKKLWQESIDRLFDQFPEFYNRIQMRQIRVHVARMDRTRDLFSNKSRRVQILSNKHRTIEAAARKDVRSRLLVCCAYC